VSVGVGVRIFARVHASGCVCVTFALVSFSNPVQTFNQLSVNFFSTFFQLFVDHLTLKEKSGQKRLM
jgi:hypothetical protein